MLTAGQALHQAAAGLTAAGIETARLDARLLLAEVMAMQPQAIMMKQHLELSPDEAARFNALIGRRMDREPVSHLLGRRGFWTLDLKVTRDTLDPRPDTETLIEAVLDGLPERGRPRRILDLGTGTGCILLALLSELGFATGLGVDKSPAALEVARANAEALGLADRVCLQSGDWGQGLDQRFDIIVSNPPYIPDGEIDGLEPEVARFEPRLALAGGPDGLDCYRMIAPQLSRLMAPGGMVALEVGAGQAGDVAALVTESGLRVREIRSDLAGVERCVVAIS
ncbi:peptide chain release factor N(5)-glutamine methyltransferase [Paramagnetospirillum kuznetsovii]|uniref:Release factor glutamine methyltransferase n=1 Tax=Paramagnetospirillum kuznetsovii TaxID=2053833 RepID=A0A364P108_9PROT|nr:peptide chain release factor N(5)-glutamine methyltransferase [Paramagnetospirillum kuznetsovii]RAU22940.1 peptide chain release factor N(5)-glutamine methyltransferase [Paramagnetospirillum kuznetsovii]